MIGWLRNVVYRAICPVPSPIVVHTAMYTRREGRFVRGKPDVDLVWSGRRVRQAYLNVVAREKYDARTKSD